MEIWDVGMFLAIMLRFFSHQKSFHFSQISIISKCVLIIIIIIIIILLLLVCVCIDAHACGDQRRPSDVFSMILHFIPLRQGLSRRVELVCQPVRPSFPPVLALAAEGLQVFTQICLVLYLGVGDLNSGPSTCAVSVLTH